VKRGLITWDKSEIPDEVFARRLESVRRQMAGQELSALLVYSDVWRSNQARYFCNYMPYFNRALLVIPRDFGPTLLCGLSPRVYGWIRSVTTIEDVRPAGDFATPLFQLADEQHWTQVGALDFDHFPSDVNKAIQGGSVEIVNVKSDDLFTPQIDPSEQGLRRKAAAMLEEVVIDELPKGVGSSDHHFAGRLERRFRTAGVEDLIILISNGHSVPAPPVGAILEENYSVSVAMEYRGHWVRLSRPHAPPQVLEQLKNLANAATFVEKLDGEYPYEIGAGVIHAKHVEFEYRGKRLFYGDTFL
jgi:hypothetical protein